MKYEPWEQRALDRYLALEDGDTADYERLLDEEHKKQTTGYSTARDSTGCYGMWADGGAITPLDASLLRWPLDGQHDAFESTAKYMDHMITRHLEQQRARSKVLAEIAAMDELKKRQISDRQFMLCTVSTALVALSYAIMDLFAMHVL